MRVNWLARKYRAEDPGTGDAGAGAPEVEIAGTGGETALDDGVNWDNIEGVDDVEPEVTTEPEVAEEIAPVPEAEVAPPEETPLTPETAAEEVAPQSPAEPAPAATETPTTAEDVSKMREEFHATLKDYYKFDDETALRLQTEPELVLPQLAADLHLGVLDAVMQQLPQRMYGMMEQFTASTQRETAARNEFTEAFPELKGQEEVILRVGKMYRAAKPTATRAEAIKAIGEFTMQSLGLTRAAPTDPVTQSPTAKPFVPATGTGAQAPETPKSVWDEMAQNDD